MRLTSSEKQALELARDHGFEYEEMGGDCTAFTRRVGGGAAPILEMVITRADRPFAPATVWLPCAFGVHDLHGEFVRDMEEHPTLMAALARADAYANGEVQ